jgi:hypothetical protein
MIAERVGAGKAKAKQLGRHVHGRIPYGYSSARRVRTGPDGAEGPEAQHGNLVISEPEAAVVRDIFARAGRGENPSSIARALNDAGVAGPRGGRWSRQTATLILRNPVYAGERYGMKNAQPAIVTRRTWNRAQQRVLRRD